MILSDARAFQSPLKCKYLTFRGQLFIYADLWVKHIF